MSDKKKVAASRFNTDGLCVSLIYKNDLPEPPYPPKFLSVRDLLPADRFVKYGHPSDSRTPAPGMTMHAPAQCTSASFVAEADRSQPAARQWALQHNPLWQQPALPFSFGVRPASPAARWARSRLMGTGG